MRRYMATIDEEEQRALERPLFEVYVGFHELAGLLPAPSASDDGSASGRTGRGRLVSIRLRSTKIWPLSAGTSCVSARRMKFGAMCRDLTLGWVYAWVCVGCGVG